MFVKPEDKLPIKKPVEQEEEKAEVLPLKIEKK